jgi:hypothetical protein
MRPIGTRYRARRARKRRSVTNFQKRKAVRYLSGKSKGEGDRFFFPSDGPGRVAAETGYNFPMSLPYRNICPRLAPRPRIC